MENRNYKFGLMKYIEIFIIVLLVVIIVVASILKGIKSSEYITLVLVVITVYYAYQSRISNRIMEESNKISYRPYLAFMGIKNIEKYFFDKEKQNMVCIQIELELMNVGKVPLKYTMNKISISIGEKKSNDTQYVNRGSYIFPTQKTLFFCELTPEIDINQIRVNGILEYELEYYSTINVEKRYKSRKKIKYTEFDKKTNWQFIEEEEEEKEEK